MSWFAPRHVTHIIAGAMTRGMTHTKICDVCHNLCPNTWYVSPPLPWYIQWPMLWCHNSRQDTNACHHPCHNAYHHQCHNVTYSVKTHDACHCPCNDTGCVPWLCHCPCNDTRCVSWLCHNLAMHDTLCVHCILYF